MPKNKFQDVVFTFLMASVMVYGMVVYNLTLNTGTVTEAVFVSAFRELPVMIPAAFVLEFFIVGKIAKKLAFKVMRRMTARSLSHTPFRSVSAASCVRS